MYSFSVVHHNNGNSCPPGLFSCGENSSVCIEQKHWCDNETQCPNGEDEDKAHCSELKLYYKISLFKFSKFLRRH